MNIMITSLWGTVYNIETQISFYYGNLFEYNTYQMSGDVEMIQLNKNQNILTQLIKLYNFFDITYIISKTLFERDFKLRDPLYVSYFIFYFFI